MIAECQGLVSIVIPAYNCEATISDSIFSVLNQNYPLIEIIICDDSSTDNTANILNEFSVKYDNIKIVNNIYIKGASGARNSCITHCNGRYISFLDSDDIWSKEKLSTQISFMARELVNFSYGSYWTFKDSIDNTLGQFEPKDSISFYDLIKSCDIGCSTVVIDRDYYKDFRFLYTDKEDFATWVYLLSDRTQIAKKFPSCFVYYRIGENSLSSNKLLELYRQNRVLKNVAKLSFIARLICLTIYSLKGLKKHIYNYKVK